MSTSGLTGRVVAVFGGTGALGGAVVRRLREDGAEVVAADAHPPAEDAPQDGVTYAEVDVLDEAQVMAFFAGLVRPPWGVVNLIGGFTPGQPLAALDLDVLVRQLELNVVTAATITKHALTHFELANEDGGAGGPGGRIVHTSSRVAEQDGRNGFAYSVSKLGVVRLVEAAAAEARDLGVTVNCIMPSIIDTPANRASMPKADHARWPKPEQIAAVVSFLVSDDAALVSGASVPVYGLA